MVVVDISPNAYEGGHQEIFEALLSVDMKKIESRKMADHQLSAAIPDFGVRQFLLKNLTRNKSGSYRWKMNLTAIHKNYQNILAKILLDDPYTGPSLFIRGGRSKYIQEKDEPMILSFFPQALIQTIPEAGHWVHAEAPKALLTIFRNFMVGVTK